VKRVIPARVDFDAEAFAAQRGGNLFEPLAMPIEESRFGLRGSDAVRARVGELRRVVADE